MSVVVPDYKWNSAYWPCYFGCDSGDNGFPFDFSSVTNINGKAQFTSGSNPYGTAPGKYLYIDSGVYQGIHIIVSVDPSGNILTSTNYSSTDAQTGFICVNYIYRIYYQTENIPVQTTDVKPVWRLGSQDASLVVDIQAFLQSMFTIQPPVLGYDDNMYKWFAVQIIAAPDYKVFLDNNSLDEATTISTYTDGYNYADDENFFIALNGVIDNDIIQSNNMGPSDELMKYEPITFTGHCIIFSKIIYDPVMNTNNKVFNLKVCV